MDQLLELRITAGYKHTHTTDYGERQRDERVVRVKETKPISEGGGKEKIR